MSNWKTVCCYKQLYVTPEHYVTITGYKPGYTFASGTIVTTQKLRDIKSLSVSLPAHRHWAWSCRFNTATECCNYQFYTTASTSSVTTKRRNVHRCKPTTYRLIRKKIVLWIPGFKILDRRYSDFSHQYVEVVTRQLILCTMMQLNSNFKLPNTYQQTR